MEMLVLVESHQTDSNVDYLEIRSNRAGVILGADDKSVSFELAREWLPLKAIFAPYAISYAFIAQLLALKPRIVVIDALSTVTMDLARLAAALGFEVAVRLPERIRLEGADALTVRWLQGLFSMVPYLLPSTAPNDEAYVQQRLSVSSLQTVCLDEIIDREVSEPGGGTAGGFGYEAYALGQRDHNLLYEMQFPFAMHFQGCRQVLDVGCGTGIFLEVLARHGIAARGVERNEVSARFARSLGHDVVVDDALHYLDAHPESCDGLYCSHFIEHLPIDAAEQLIKLSASALKPGGVAVFVFPDPESVRSQLLGFWRDPEHVRFYHSELVMALARVYGLEVEYDSHQIPGRRIVPFSMEPPLSSREEKTVSGRWSRLLRRFGMAPIRELNETKRRVDELENAVREIWSVNQTWAWDDNAVLRFRKREALS